MAELIKMPRLSDTMEEGTVATWFKKVGDKVEEGEILAEIENDRGRRTFNVAGHSREPAEGEKEEDPIEDAGGAKARGEIGVHAELRAVV